MFKNKVQNLIDQNILSFTEEKPNVKVNPLSNHGNHMINSIIEEDSTKVVHLVENVKTPWASISMSMHNYSALACVHYNCKVCKTEPERCEELKDCVEELKNQGIFQFSRDKVLGEVSIFEPIEIVYRKKQVKALITKVQPIVFHVPSHFPYHNSKVGIIMQLRQLVVKKFRFQMQRLSISMVQGG